MKTVDERETQKKIKIVDEREMKKKNKKNNKDRKEQGRTEALLKG